VVICHEGKSLEGSLFQLCDIYVTQLLQIAMQLTLIMTNRHNSMIWSVFDEMKPCCKAKKNPAMSRVSKNI
jgi:hypothetical protein